MSAVPRALAALQGKRASPPSTNVPSALHASGQAVPFFDGLCVL